MDNLTKESTTDADLQQQQAEKRIQKLALLIEKAIEEIYSHRRGFYLMKKENELTKEQKDIIEIINNMSHYSMCELWRNAPTGHLYFDKTLPFFKVFEKRLFEHFGGFTPEISKSIGWNL